MMVQPRVAAHAQPAAHLSAADSDPVKMGWMVGFPPPPDKRIRWADGSHFNPPSNRWGLSHFHQFLPHVSIRRGDGPVSELPRAERKDIDAVTFKIASPVDLSEAAKEAIALFGTTISWAQSLDANYTDSIVVLHRGRIVYERYRGVTRPETQHFLMSVTKSLPGLLAEILIDEGSMDERAPVSRYLPELKNSGFGDATVRQVLDHVTGVKYSDAFDDPNADIWHYAQVIGVLPRQPGFAGPDNLYDYLASLKKEGEHGMAFGYKDVNTDVAGWLLKRVTGQTCAELASERLWSKLGAERDAYWVVDSAGFEICGAGIGTTVRDLARWGETMRLGGRFNGQQIVSKAVVEKIFAGGDPDIFAKGHYGPGLPGWSYRSYFWVHPAEGVIMWKGLFGQGMYVNPRAEVVIARNCSHWNPSNSALDATSLPAYAAVVKLLSGH